MDLVIMLVAFMNLNLILGVLVFKSLKLDENLIEKKATVLPAKELLVCDHFIIIIHHLLAKLGFVESLFSVISGLYFGIWRLN